MRTLIFLVSILSAGTSHAQSLPWVTGNTNGWFTAVKLDPKGNKLIIVCNAANQEQAAIIYMPKIPVRGMGQIEISLGLDGTIVPAGSWNIVQGAVAIKDYASVVDLIEKVSESFTIDVQLVNQPGASFDNRGFDEVGKGLAQACGR